MDSWERFDETSLPDKKHFYSELNSKGITDKEYSHAQKVFEEFCTDIGDYHDLYIQSDTLLFANVFEKFRDTSIEIYGIDPSRLLFEPGFARKACLKRTNVNLELLTNIHMLLMIEEGIRGGMCQYVGMVKQIINTKRIMIKALIHYI